MAHKLHSFSDIENTTPGHTDTRSSGDQPQIFLVHLSTYVGFSCSNNTWVSRSVHSCSSCLSGFDVAIFYLQNGQGASWGLLLSIIDCISSRHDLQNRLPQHWTTWCRDGEESGDRLNIQSGWPKRLCLRIHNYILSLCPQSHEFKYLLLGTANFMVHGCSINIAHAHTTHDLIGRHVRARGINLPLM